MGDSSVLNDQEDGPDLGLPLAKSENSGKKIRRTFSCVNCQKRKVKCDRVKPCRACCVRGAADECEYETDKHDRQYIEQSDLIERLRWKCLTLEKQLAAARESTIGPKSKKMALSGGTSVSPAERGRPNDESRPIISKDEKFQLVPRSSVKDMGSQPPSKLHMKLPSSLPLEKPVIEYLVSELIDGFEGNSSIFIGSTLDLRAAANLRGFSSFVSEAFEATSLAFASQRDPHPDLHSVVSSRYGRLLRLLGVAMRDHRRQTSTEVLIVVVLFTIIEAFQQSTPDGILRHQLGGLEILRVRSPYRHTAGLDRSLFVDLRLFWVTAAIVSRRPTFLAHDNWIHVPWTKDYPPKDILHYLLDVAVMIPAFLSHCDELSSALREHTLHSSDRRTARFEVRAEFATIDRRLQEWKNLHADHYALGLNQETSQEDGYYQNDPVPRLRCKDVATGELLEPTIFHFPDLMLAMSMILYYAFRLIITVTDAGEVSLPLQPHSRYKLACNICRCMPYLVRHMPKFLISRIMFPVRTAYDTFSADMIEKEFITQMFTYIGEKHKFPLFTNSCTASQSKG